MVQFMEMSDRDPAHPVAHAAWILIGFATKLGHSVSTPLLIQVSHLAHDTYQIGLRELG